MQFIISEPGSNKSLAQIHAQTSHAVRVTSTWDGHERTVSPYEALRLLTIAIADGLQIEAYPDTRDTAVQ